MTDPRFPNRPDHPDFWLLSEVLISQDAVADAAVEPYEDMVARYVDMDSLMYAAKEQVGLFLQLRGDGQYVYSLSEVSTMLRAVFLSAFVFGARFQHRKNGDPEIEEVPDDQH